MKPVVKRRNAKGAERVACNWNTQSFNDMERCGS